MNVNRNADVTGWASYIDVRILRLEATMWGDRIVDV